MEAPVPAPPVIDYARQSRMAEMLESASPFNMFNVVAIVIIAIAAFFLYKRYKDKHATERAHMMRPSPIISPPASAPIVQEVPTPAPESESVNEVKQD